MPNFGSSALDRMAHVKSPLAMLFQDWSVSKGSSTLSVPCTETDVDTMWNELLAVEYTPSKDEFPLNESISSKHGVAAFLTHCCKYRHYSFQIKNCSSETCEMYEAVRLSKEGFDSPDLVPGEDRKSMTYLVQNR